MTLTRRAALSIGFGLAVLPVAAFAGAPAQMTPAQMTPAQVQALQAAGKPVLVVFRADWCSTCAAQERAIGAILSDDPALANTVTIALIDWDLYADDAFTKALNIPRRSTLVKFNGAVEVGRLVAQTGRAQIEALIRA